MRSEQEKRFWARVDLSTPDEAGACWEWKGCRDKAGYGLVRFDGRSRRTHRVAWFLEHGVWPPLVRHRCDNPPCVRIDHLLTGTNADNSRDREERGHTSRGERHPGAKLTDEKVYRMKQLRAQGWSRAMLAREFGVAMGTVQLILAGQRWTHIHLDEEARKAVERL